MPTIAAFDFDGTVTYRDSFIPFLRYCAPGSQFVLKMIRAFPSVMRDYLTKLNYRQACKEHLVKEFFAGWPLHRLQELANQFANSDLNQKIRPKALARIKWHQDQGHRCILISASPDLYLNPWASAAGFDRVIGTRLAVDFNGNINGKLQGLNCRGQEKVRRLESEMGPKSHYTLYAYGDSDGDHELLALADFPFYRPFAKGSCL